ncbi:MAG: lasso RiPP family leader peptide-containing protein [Chloroflexi bacterium]|nr:lasso RiPP family leader peptide-containing protein [Chloroflexota bacterium]
MEKRNMEELIFYPHGGLMSNIDKLAVEEKSATPDKTHKPYHRPSLEELGDLRTLTLGGSPGPDDSGIPTEQP